MESSSSSSIAANSSAAVKPDTFVSAGNALLPAFERHISHIFFRKYVSVDKTLREFSDLELYFQCQQGRSGLVGMEERVVGYLLGRACTGATLKVVIESPTWLQSIYVGLLANPRIDVSLDILVQGHGFGEDIEWDLLEDIASFLERSPSARGLRIVSASVLGSFGPHIAQAIRTNKLHTLDISNIALRSSLRTESGEMKHVRDEFHTERDFCKEVAEALIQNTSIKVLRVKALSTFLNIFVPQDSTAGNQRIEDLTLMFMIMGVETVDFPQLRNVLSTNRTLLKIRFVNANLPARIWMRIVDSLKTNSILQVLDIGSSNGWVEKAILSALLNLVRTQCTQIIDMGLAAVHVDSTDVDIYNEVLKEALPALNEQLRLNREYGQVLKNVPRGPPRSARIVFCGPGYAGKTTLCNTMLKHNNRWMRRRISTFLQKRPKLWRFLYGPEAEKELHKRTRGVDMHLWQDQQDLRITLWDFAGQKEYYALHDYLFPNVNSANLFLFVFSLIASPFDTVGQNGDTSARLLGIEKELLFWLQFLCSNSKEVIDPKPRVRVIITSIDRVDPSTLAQWRFRLDAIFDRLKSRFENRIDLVRPTIFLNAHCEELVAAVEAQILDDFTDMVPKLEPTFAICEDVRRKLGERMNSTPVIRVDEYDKICLQVDEAILHTYDTRQAVASYLHNVGEIIYFRNLDFIVINPRWLGVGVLGNLLAYL